ncbi:MAG: N-acyl homoserine lactonase family protein [Thiohalomonadales bacterium]
MKSLIIKNILLNIVRSSILIFIFLSVSVNATEKKVKLEDLGEPAKIELKLYVFNCGEIEVRDLSVFNPAIPKGTVKTLSDACYLIVHPNGMLFWDGGLPDDLVTQIGGAEVSNGLFKLSKSRTLKSQFEEIGVDPLSVDYIALSHLHFDHTGSANYFTNAKWLIQKSEFDIAFTPEGINIGFVPESYNLLQNNVQELQGHYDVFGDKSVVIISTPGHTPGHQALYINLPKTGKIILSGDLYHFKENRINYGIPDFNTSKRETIHSFVLMDNLLDRLNATLWIQHDKPFFESLNLSPSFYQ